MYVCMLDVSNYYQIIKRYGEGITTIDNVGVSPMEHMICTVRFGYKKKCAIKFSLDWEPKEPET